LQGFQETTKETYSDEAQNNMEGVNTTEVSHIQVVQVASDGCELLTSFSDSRSSTSWSNFVAKEHSLRSACIFLNESMSFLLCCFRNRYLSLSRGRNT
jgi:hypothetical protein